MVPETPVDLRVARRAPAWLAAAIFLWSCGSAGEPAAPGAGTAGSSGTGLPAASLDPGLQLFRRGDLKGAEPHLAGALKQAPRDRRILEALGSIYARTDRWRQA